MKTQKEKSLERILSYLKPFKHKIKQANHLLREEVDSSITKDIKEELELVLEKKEDAYCISLAKEQAKDVATTTLSLCLFNKRRTLFNRLRNLIKQTEVGAESYFLTLLPQEEVTNRLEDMFKQGWKIKDLIFKSECSQLSLFHINQGVLYISFRINYDNFDPDTGATLYRLLGCKYNHILNAGGGIQ